jgi:hypothetical protein
LLGPLPRRRQARPSNQDPVKNIVHTFSRDVVSHFLDSHPKTHIAFELMAALMMHRLYEQQWQQPTMIGFYMIPKYADILNKNPDCVDYEVFMEALESGIQENHQIDFVLSTYEHENGAHQEFQLKRFGMQAEQLSTDSLVTYLNGMPKKYTRTDAACLVAITDINQIDFPKVRDQLNKETFPFGELLVIGVSYAGQVYRCSTAT